MKDAARLDAEDPLAPLRAAFDLPDGTVYLDGNSLGPPTKAALARLDRAARSEWRDGLIAAWNGAGDGAGWIDLPERAGAKIARLIGATPGDVIVADSVSANIFKLAGALHEKSGHGGFAVYDGEFPTDAYVLEGLARTLRAPLRRLPREASLRGENVSVAVRSLVDYRSGAVAEMRAAEDDAAEAGAAIIWDLSHATGLLSLDLPRDGARYAVGCGYKFLNGGPGAPAFIYVRGAAAQGLASPLQGWMGAADPFAFGVDYAPADGVRRFLNGTPPVLSLAALDASLDLFEGIDMDAVEAKARALGDRFIARADAMGLATISPKAPVRRGGQAAFRFEAGYALIQALIARGVTGDFRAPDLIRFGFSPLFLRYQDIDRAADILEEALHREDWRRPEFSQRRRVT